MNVETEPKTRWCGDGETELIENLHLGNGSHYEKIEKLLPFCKYASYGKISSYQTPKVWVSGFIECQWKQIICLGHYEKIERKAALL